MTETTADMATDTAGMHDVASSSELDPRIDSIIKDHMIAAMAFGLVPVPVFDMVAVIGVQLRMVHSLTRHHDVPFRKDLARSAILSLLGGVAPAALGTSATSLLKFIPGLGTIGGTVGVVLLAGATTYAVGRIFAEHLASGGTLLTLRTEDVAERFKTLFGAGKTYAANLRDAVLNRKPAADDPKNAAAPDDTGTGSPTGDATPKPPEQQADTSTGIAAGPSYRRAAKDPPAI